MSPDSIKMVEPVVTDGESKVSSVSLAFSPVFDCFVTSSTGGSLSVYIKKLRELCHRLFSPVPFLFFMSILTFGYSFDVGH